MPPETRKDWFLEAVADTKHAMYRAALIMLRNPMDAQDAVSDALEATWRQMDRIRDLNALPSYLMRSCINASHKVIRRRRRETTLDDLTPYLPPAQPEIPVWIYLSHLPDKYRLPLLLRFGEGYSDQQIASIMGLPRGTVSSRLSRGLKVLKQQIEMEEKGRG